MPGLTAEQVAEVTSVLFAAALDQSRWQDFLTRLSDYFGYVGTHLYGYDLSTNFALEPLSHGYDPDFMKSYGAYYGALNAWAPGLGRAPIGAAVTSAECMPEEELFKTEFYNDWIRPQGDSRAGAGVVLSRDHGRFFVMGGNMIHKHAHREAEWARTLNMLAPHMRQSLEIGRAMFDGNAQEMLAGPAGRVVGGAVLAISPRRMARYANATALAMLQSGSILRFDGFGRVSFADPEGDNALDLALMNLRWPSRGPVSGRFAVRGSQGQSTIVRFARVESDRLGYIPVGFATSSGEPHLLVAIQNDSRLVAVQQSLRLRYGLTESETAVAIMVADGLVPDEIARKRDVSLHTVRDQIKAGLRKTGTSRQAALVRLVEGLRHNDGT